MRMLFWPSVSNSFPSEGQTHFLLSSVFAFSGFEQPNYVRVIGLLAKIGVLMLLSGPG